MDQDCLWKCERRNSIRHTQTIRKRVITTTFFDANLLHVIVTRKSVTAVMNFVNTTPTDWFLKRQATVETATYGPEFVTAITATEQILELRRSLGVPIMTKT